MLKSLTLIFLTISVFSCPDEIGCMSCKAEVSRLINVCKFCARGFVNEFGKCDFGSFDPIPNCLHYEKTKQENGQTRVTCKKCEFGFNSNGTSCVSCSVPGCALCDQPDVCNGCFDGKKLIIDKDSSPQFTCSQNELNEINDCDVSYKNPEKPDEVFCKYCFNGFATDYSEKTCFPSKVVYCEKFENKNDNKCDICGSDFHVTKTGACRINYCRKEMTSKQE